jgi:hypothetical protein
MSAATIHQSKLTSPDSQQPQVVSEPRDFFALSISTSQSHALPTATSASAGVTVHPSILREPDAVKVFQEDFKIQFCQRFVCSDAEVVTAHDPLVCVRSASLSDIQDALQDVARCMLASHECRKKLSLLVHLNMQLSSQDGTSARDAASSDGLVATTLHALCSLRV